MKALREIADEIDREKFQGVGRHTSTVMRIVNNIVRVINPHLNVRTGLVYVRTGLVYLCCDNTIESTNPFSKRKVAYEI